MQRNLLRRISSLKMRPKELDLLGSKQRTGIEKWFPILMLSSQNNKQTFSKKKKTRKQKTNERENNRDSQMPESQSRELAKNRDHDPRKQNAKNEFSTRRKNTRKETQKRTERTVIQNHCFQKTKTKEEEG